MTEDTDVLNIHCDLISDSLVDGEESDIIFSFTTRTFTPSFNFTFEPKRVFLNPVNRPSILQVFVSMSLMV